jgi:pilus assembly protein CpaC
MQAAIIIVILLVTGIGTAVGNAVETVNVQINHAMLIKVRNADRVVVAAPEVADVNLITRGELMIVARKVGDTTVTVWDARGVTTYRVLVTLGPATDVVQAIGQAIREPRVQVRVVGQVVVLEGTVRTDADKKRAEDIAKALAEGRAVANALTVEQTPATQAEQARAEAERDRRDRETALREALRAQGVTVRLLDRDTAVIEGSVTNQEELRRIEAIAKAMVKNVTLLIRVTAVVTFHVNAMFVEVDRQALQQMGVEWGGGNVADLLTDPFAFHFGNLGQSWPTTPLQLLVARIRLLEQRNAARTLANPRLVVIEGRPAKLLVGGELPIPIVGADRTVTVQFREFGVRLEFKPVIEGGDNIMMDIKTEVSSLDFANAIVASGFVIPAIRKREVQTSISMKPGEFLLLGGMIQREQSQIVQRIPLLGDLPIIGALFRSTRFQRGETELVVFVSPTIVRPTREAPAVPADPAP